LIRAGHVQRHFVRRSSINKKDPPDNHKARAAIMMSSSPSDFRRVLEPQLRLGEKLIWVGQPEPAQFAREVARACVLQLALFAVFIPVSVWVISHLARPEKSIVPAILLVGGMILYFVLAAPWRYRDRVLQTIYAITDQRALVYKGFGWSLLWLQPLPDLYNTLWSFDARQIRARRRLQRYEGRADLVFAGERRYHVTGRGQIQDWVQVGFLGLKDLDEVDRLLENHFARVEAQPV
jgi:hypothetical protein